MGCSTHRKAKMPAKKAACSMKQMREIQISHPNLTPEKQRNPNSNIDVIRNTLIIQFSYTYTHMHTCTGFVLNPAGMI